MTDVLAPPVGEVLKPCPFCGQLPAVSEFDAGDEQTRWAVACDCSQADETAPYIEIYINVLADTRLEAVGGWNRRPSLAAPTVQEGEDLGSISAQEAEIPTERAVAWCVPGSLQGLAMGDAPKLMWGTNAFNATEPLYAQPRSPVCQGCGSEIQGWICQGCGLPFKERDDGVLVVDLTELTGDASASTLGIAPSVPRELLDKAAYALGRTVLGPQLHALLAASPQPVVAPSDLSREDGLSKTIPDMDKALTVINAADWTPCSPAWLSAHPADCGVAPRVWCEAETNHYHPKNWKA